MSAGSRSTSWTTLRGAVVWDGLQAVLDRLAGDGRSLSVVDAGGGTGGFAVPLAQRGHRVTVIDPSFDSLASLDRRAGERGVADRVEGRQGDLSTLGDLVPPGYGRPGAVSQRARGRRRPCCGAGVRRGHAPPRWRGQRARRQPHGSGARPRGRRSHRRRAGRARRPGRARRTRATRSSDGSTGRACPGWWSSVGLSVDAVHGVRVTLDLVPGSLLEADADAYDALLRLERAASQLPALRDVATQFHLLASRP